MNRCRNFSGSWMELSPLRNIGSWRGMRAGWLGCVERTGAGAASGGWAADCSIKNFSSRCFSFSLFISARIRLLRSRLAGESSSCSSSHASVKTLSAAAAIIAFRRATLSVLWLVDETVACDVLSCGVLFLGASSCGASACAASVRGA